MIVLDTHIWVWWVTNPSKLSADAAECINRETSIGICTVSCWEVATLVRKGRLRFDRDLLQWVGAALARPFVQPIPLDVRIAMAAGAIGDHLHGDPSDRIIVATASVFGVPLVTEDAAIHTSALVETIW